MFRLRILIPIVAVIVLGVGAWLWLTANRETTDDAQTEAHVIAISARVGGTVTSVLANDNQTVESDATLVEIDPRDYQIAVDRAKAELADAEAAATAAQSGIAVTSTNATSNETNARGGTEQARAGIDEAEKGIEAAKARLESARSGVKQVEANATKAAKDVDRLKGLLAKDEVSQQMYDAAVAAADGQRAGVDAAKGGVAEAEAGVRVAQSRLLQAQVGERQSQAALRNAETAPQQISAVRARAASAAAHAQQMRAQLAQAELNLEHATVKAPLKGLVSRKSVEAGQSVAAGQPLLAIIPLDDVWVTANFKETQLQNMRPGQRVTVKIDALGGKEFNGKIDSIAAATGARFALLPPENATGNYVKVVQRVPVKILLDAGQDPEHLLRPGLSAEPTVYTK